jgi:2-polyprenyl-3-methyl-5-hydroxy-6-metoxy-1,4-benzoquinol methylase
MIMEPVYSINCYKYLASRTEEDKEGYQRYDVDFKNNALVPKKGDKLEAKSRVIEPIFRNKLKGKSVIDIGCDKGYFSWLAYKSGAAKVVSVDIRQKLENHIAFMAKVMKWPITPITFDLFGGEGEFARKFDYALALAMIHQVEAPPQRVIERIRSLVDQGAIIEFCEDYREVKGPEWTLDNFEKMVGGQFSSIEFIDKYDAVGQWVGKRYVYDCRC